jgi:hypothetical protein
MAELGDQAARWLEREKQQAQQRGLAGPRRSGEKLKGMRLDTEREVAQHLRTETVTKTYVFESDHARLR